jgi:hypothetical protein
LVWSHWSHFILLRGKKEPPIGDLGLIGGISTSLGGKLGDSQWNNPHGDTLAHACLYLVEQRNLFLTKVAYGLEGRVLEHEVADVVVAGARGIATLVGRDSVTEPSAGEACSGMASRDRKEARERLPVFVETETPLRVVRI